MFKIKCPFDMPGYKEGSSVNSAELLAAIAIYVKALQKDRDDLEKDLEEANELIEEMEFRIDRMMDEMETQKQNINDYYQMKNPYKVNGVSPLDY